MVGPFALLRSLSTPAELPPRGREALENLRRFIDARGGTIKRSDLRELDDELARLLAHNAARHRVVLELVERGPPFPFEGWNGMLRFVSANVEALLAAERTADPEISFSDLDEGWFATYFTRLMTMEAWNHQPGANGTGPMSFDVLRSSERELVKLLGIERALKEGPGAARKRELLRLRGEASRKVLLAAFTGASDAKSLAHAAEQTPPVLREIYQWVAEHAPADPLDAPPEISHAILERLGLEGVYALRVAAAKDQEADLGTLPVLASTATFLEEEGLLDRTTFADLVVRLRSHALPSFQQLIATMERYGMKNFEVDASKGSSTNPLTIAGIERTALRVDPAYGDSWRSPEAQARHLTANAKKSFAEARRTKKPLLVLGEGYASARALHDAAAAYPDVRAGYVAFTQSGLNFLRDQPKLRFFVESLADALLKKLTESRPLGDWIVARELELQAEEGARPPSEQVAVVIGYGDSVGPGIAKALRERGFKDVVIVDRDRARLEGAERDGFSSTVLAAADGSFPPGDLYFTAAGQPNIVGERALRSVSDDAVVVIHGSSVESDKHFIHRARTRKIPGVRARALEKNKLPDHRTLEIRFLDQDGKRARLRKMGQPFFDGKRDKDRLLVDVYMSGLLTAMAVAAKRLKEEQTPDRISTLSADLQVAIAERIEAHYGVALTAEIQRQLSPV